MELAVTYDPLERKRPLNYLEACRLARELWGEAGSAELRYDKPVGERYIVGTKGAEPAERAIGYGSTWEEAFNDAERRGRAS